MTTAATATFHPFPRLSPELRNHIWELTVEPRIVEVRVVWHRPTPLKVKVSEPGASTEKWMDKPLPPMRHLRSPTPAPAQLQTCREAREHLTKHPDDRIRYEKAFSEITTTPYGGFVPVPEDDPERDRYVWFNFDNDMVSIGKTDMSDFRAVAYQVRRLRLERVLSDEYFARNESELIGRYFRYLTEIRLICLDGIRAAYTITEDTYFPCGPENVYFVDQKEGGMMLNSFDVDAMVLREGEEYEKRNEQGEEG